MAPWADILYACDGQWWDVYRGAPSFSGLKISQDAGACVRYRDVHHVTAEPQIDKLLFSTPGVLGSGGNSGFQALNLVAQFGATRIILIGFDMRIDTGVHWHGPHRPPLHNPHEATVMRWRQAWNAAAPTLRQRGIEVFNSSAESLLTAYPYATPADVIEGKV